MSKLAVNYNQKWLIQLHTIDSTNNYAIKLIEDGLAHHGDVVWSLEQTKGKGQRGKEWITKPNENIMISLILKGEGLENYNPIQINIIIAQTVCIYFKHIIPKAKITIKWPNDIYINDKKTAGILIENVFRGNKWTSAIIGLGINVNQTQFPDFLPNAGSLALFSNKQFDLFPIISDLRAGILNAFNQFSNENFENILNNYNNNLYGKNEYRTFINLKTKQHFEGKVIEVDRNGFIIIETEDGKTKFTNGSLQWLF
ncbi:MAG TPA: biotin--[acetyl-CoA-carboxylase] ligase [Edaphocola sp.]|nr:biotin--[acetyl-CoA-carboxylase] ligase [Edaphocola sp.]